MDKSKVVYDIVLKGGKVIDPSQGINRTLDIGIKRTRIAALEKEIPVNESSRIIDAGGKIITPGLIDLHGHIYAHVVHLGIAPDIVGVKAGVTTIIDAGTAGYATLGGFRQFIVAFARTTVYCFLHLCPTGLCLSPEVSPWDKINLKHTIKVVQANRDIVRGIKIRDSGAYTNDQRLDAILKAKEVAKETRLPLMVHFGNPDAGTETENLSRRILPLLEKGDILSHVYTPHPGRVIGTDGNALPELIEARERGVIFDVARGKNNIGFEVAKLGLAKGILPDTISSDITSMNYNGPVFNLPTVMSQFMALGLNLEQVIEMTTVNPAKALAMDDEIGSLKVGRQADVSIFQLVAGKWEFWDSVGKSISAEKLLLPVSTIKSGQEIIAEPTLRG